MPKRPFRIGRSLTGLGLFATRPIRKNTRIAEYTGRLLTTKEAEKAERRGNRYLYEINSRWTIDGTARNNIARYFNHSCNPNTESYTRQAPGVHAHHPQHQAGRGALLRLRHRLSQERHRPFELQMLALPQAARPQGARGARAEEAPGGPPGAGAQECAGGTTDDGHAAQPQAQQAVGEVAGRVISAAIPSPSCRA